MKNSLFVCLFVFKMNLVLSSSGCPYRKYFDYGVPTENYNPLVVDPLEGDSLQQNLDFFASESLNRRDLFKRLGEGINDFRYIILGDHDIGDSLTDNQPIFNVTNSSDFPFKKDPRTKFSIKRKHLIKMEELNKINEFLKKEKKKYVFLKRYLMSNCREGLRNILTTANPNILTTVNSKKKARRTCVKLNIKDLKSSQDNNDQLLNTVNFFEEELEKLKKQCLESKELMKSLEEEYDIHVEIVDFSSSESDDDETKDPTYTQRRKVNKKSEKEEKKRI